MMITVDETDLWTAIDALDAVMEEFEGTMEGNEDQESMYESYSTARESIMRQIKTSQSK